MKKLFISMPMNGLGKESIMAKRTELLRLAMMTLGCEMRLLDSINPNAQNDAPLKSLGLSLGVMSEADIIIFSNGYDEARGCKIEWEAAWRYLGDRHILTEAELRRLAASSGGYVATELA